MNNGFDTYEDPDEFIKVLSNFIDGLNKQKLTKNSLERKEKEFKKIFNFLSGNGMYLIQILGEDHDKSNKIYKLLEKLALIDSKRYPDNTDNFQRNMRTAAIESKNRKSRKSRKSSKSRKAN
jgi:hypothetical protein